MKLKDKRVDGGQGLAASALTKSETPHKSALAGDISLLVQYGSFANTATPAQNVPVVVTKTPEPKKQRSPGELVAKPDMGKMTEEVGNSLKKQK